MSVRVEEPGWLDKYYEGIDPNEDGWDDSLKGKDDQFYMDMIMDNTKSETDSFKSPIISVLKQRREAAETYTPDFDTLKYDVMVPVFVYGTLKHKYWNHDKLGDSPFLGRAKTMANYRMYCMNNSKIPMVRGVAYKTQAVSDSWTHPVEGEVYMCDPVTVLTLDTLESNGKMYDRKKVWVSLVDQNCDGRPPMIQVYMYIIREDFFKKVEQNSGSYPAQAWNDGKFTYCWEN